MRSLYFFSLLFIFSSCTSYPVLKEYPESLSSISSKRIAFENGSSARLVDGARDGATVVVLVRHAEKASGGNDPQLTEKGSQRAVKLAEVLDPLEIEKVYSSNYQRTLETAEPLLKKRNLEVEIYNPRELKVLWSKILKEDQGKKVLVVGHSNSTPSLANQFTGKESFPQFDESDYDNVILIEFTKANKVRASRLSLKM